MFKMTLLSATTAVLVSGSAAHADQIALSFNNESFAIIGDFLGFKDNAYIVRTAGGELHVPANIVTCEGDDCLIIVSQNQQTGN